LLQERKTSKANVCAEIILEDFKPGILKNIDECLPLDNTRLEKRSTK